MVLCRLSVLVCLKSNQDAVQTRLIKTVNICLVILICASLVEIGLFKGSR